MDERLDSIIITDLPDGAIDSILSVLCSSEANYKLFYLVYSIYELEESTGWKDVANFRLVCKSFQKVTDRVVPSFALYQQLFNKGVDPSIWITKQEEELTAKFNGFICDVCIFRESHNPLLLPDLSSMPLFALESLINVKIHELLISNAALKSMIKIAYAFPNCNTVGFTLTLPNSSLHPGKQLAFQVTNQDGRTHSDNYSITNRSIIVQVNDSSLAKVLGVPAKAHLVMNESISYSINSGEMSGEYIPNAHEWIRYLLQVSNAIQQDLPYSNDRGSTDENAMDVDTDTRSRDEWLEEWLTRKEPSTVDNTLPIFNQTSHSAQLQRIPLLPGSVVNQILNPSSTSLLQLLMMNKLIQFYRLNKYYKQVILSNLLNTQPHPGYQTTVKQLFDHLTINHKYLVYDPCIRSTCQASIHLGAVNEGFRGCYLEVYCENDGEHGPSVSIKTKAIDSSFENKITGSRYVNRQDPTAILAPLHLQQLLKIQFVLPPIDIISLFDAVVDQPKLNYMEDDWCRFIARKQYPKHEILFGSSQVDPSCTIDNVKVYEENGSPITSMFINNSKQTYYYVVLQVLQSNDNTQSFGHIRFGYKKELFSTEENEVHEYHFKTTNQFQNTDLSKNLYDYWISRLTKPKPRREELELKYGEDGRQTEIDQAHIFNMLSVQEENALSYEILYAESLKSQLCNIKTLFQNDKLAALNQIKHLHSLLPDNIMVKCCYAKLTAKLEGSFEAINLLNLWLQDRPFNGQLWMTKAKILETAQNFTESIRCYSLFCDFPTEEVISHTSNPLYLKAYRKVFQLFKRLNLWSAALRVWELSDQAQKELLNYLDSDTKKRIMLMQAKRYIREMYDNQYYRRYGFNILQSLPRTVEVVMLHVEAKYHSGYHEQVLKDLDSLLAKHPIFDIMIHKAAILHQLSRFDQAIECYQKAATMVPNQLFDIESAIHAAKKQQLVPWPFKVDFPPEAKVWTDEEIVMLFILHPNAVSSAREKVKISSNRQEQAMQYLLNELDDAQAQMDKDKSCYAHIYPVEYLSKKIFRDIPLKSIRSTADEELAKYIKTKGFDSDRKVPFIFKLHPKSKDNSTLLWYPTHPCTIPFLLANGISPDEHGVTFHANLSSCFRESYYKDDYSVQLSTEGKYQYDKAYISMALLVEVDSIAAEQNTIHEKTKGSSDTPSWRKFPMTIIHSKSHIGAICYLAIIIGTKWDAKICLVSNQSTLCD